MWSLDDINQKEETLGVQLRLALASPLWKNLPYGVQINPRSWKIEVLDFRPRRLCVQVVVPWRPGHPEKEPLHFVLMVWHNRVARHLHRVLTGLNERLNRAARRKTARLYFYDTLSHAFVGQFRPKPAEEASAVGERFRVRWAQRMFKTLAGRVKKA